jgi:spore coat polysaccharide biosynthesis protein SpsF
MKFQTDQEMFWAGEFGDNYIERNQGDNLLASNLNFFSKSLKSTSGIDNCIEFGANIGMNLKALKLLKPKIDAYAIEINKQAVEQLHMIIPRVNVFNTSILDYVPSRHYDLTFIKGVLIHINPDFLPQVYNKLYETCGRYLIVAEYYNPTPVAVSYRGHADRLFKRDFAGEIMELHPSLKLLDYGFEYKRDPNFPQDDMTWFLMEKMSS